MYETHAGSMETGTTIMQSHTWETKTYYRSTAVFMAPFGREPTAIFEVVDVLCVPARML